MLTLDKVPVGNRARVDSVGGEGQLRQHLLDMGMIPGVDVTVVKYAPMGDPIEVRVHGYDLTLRLGEASAIQVRDVRAGKCAEGETRPVVMDLGSCASCSRCASCGGCDGPSSAKDADSLRRGLYPGGHPHEREHPGLGEGGRFHDSADEHPVPDDEPLRFSLVGNLNSGKTTLFNQLTGMKLHVGNFPGVTVEPVEGRMRAVEGAVLTDLPGMYSLTPMSDTEGITYERLLDQRPHAIINVVDATNIERNLYLTVQLLELDIPMVVALNMMDEIAANGGSILVNELESQLGVPVVPICAVKGQGIDELVDHAVHVARFQERPQAQDLCSPSDNGGALHRCLHSIMTGIGDHAERAGYPLRSAASKLVEGDPNVARRLDLDENERELVEHIVVQMENERGLDRAAAMADMRFSFIDRVCSRTVVKPSVSLERRRSIAIDKVLTGRFTAIPAFIVIMALVFWLTFGVVGLALQDLLAEGIDWLCGACQAGMASVGLNQTAQSLVVNGVFGGMGSVLSFLPIIVVLFFFLSLLEDSGYMSRVAFVMDALLRKLGLSGRSIIPLLIGFGCSVPAIMASRSLPSERDRRMTVLLVPFMSCSAKLPIYACLTAAFFPDHAALVMVGLYFLGIIVGIIIALIMKNSLFKGDTVPFVMELPNYRMPGLGNVLHLMWDKARDFLRNAFTVILAASIVIWFLQTFDLTLGVVTDSSDSILAVIAGALTPVFEPLGLGDWRIATSLLTGLIAKESVIATLGVLYGGVAGLAAVITPATALVLLVFCLLYTPCVASINAVRRELGGRWAVHMVIVQCGIAWVVAFALSVVLRLMGF